MKAEVTEVAPCRKCIKVEVPAEKVDAAFDESYNVLRDNVQMKGFRKGFAPRKMLERKFHKDIANEVRGKLFQDSFGECMKENDLAPMSDPEIKVEELEAAPGTPFCYETEVDVRPSFDLPEYKGLKLTETVEAIADSEIDEQIENLRERFAQFEPIDEKSAEGDLMETDVVVKAGDEELINEKAQRLKISGEVLFGLPCKDLVKKLSGIKAGSEETLKLTLPKDFYKEELAGKKATVELKINQVLRGDLPEVNDEFAKRLGMDSLDILLERIRENVGAERKQTARQKLEQDAVDLLIEQCPFDLPEEFMKRQNEAALTRSTMQLARMGATKEFLDEKRAELEKTSKDETIRGVRRQIIFDSIADKEEIEVTEQEFQQHVTMLARSYQTTPAQMIKRIQDNNGIAAMASEIRDVKVTKLILDSADITEKTTEAADKKKKTETKAAPKGKKKKEDKKE